MNMKVPSNLTARARLGTKVTHGHYPHRGAGEASRPWGHAGQVPAPTALHMLVVVSLQPPLARLLSPQWPGPRATHGHSPTHMHTQCHKTTHIT